MDNRYIVSLREMLGRPDHLKDRTPSFEDFADVAGDDRATLILSFEGKWNVEEFEILLSLLSRIYSCFCEFLFIASVPRTGKQVDKMTCALEERFSTDPGRLMGPLYLRRDEEPLEIEQIQLASGGTIQIAGKFKPLKMISDFINAWQCEKVPNEGAVSSDEFDHFTARIESWSWALTRAKDLEQRVPNAVYERCVSMLLRNPRFLILKITRIPSLQCEYHGIG